MSKFTVDVIAFYAKVYQPDEMSDAYSIDAVADTEQAVKILESVGATPAVRRDGSPVEHQGFEGKPVYKIKRKTTTRSGESLGAPTVVDSQGNAITNLIGNGSRVRVYGKAFNWNFKGKSGTGLGLNTVQVIDLVEYNTVSKVEGGFVAKTEVPTDLSSNDGDEGAF
jgi:hypothetical protein